jgi:hypothetical protein
MRTIPSLAAVSLCLFGAPLGCADPVPPTNPSWQTDVMPILADKCVRCHGAEARGGAPPTLRLDSYGPVAKNADGAVAGAASAALQIFKRVSGIGLLRNDLKMPLGGKMNDYEIAVLRNWAALADGNGNAPRGTGNKSNSAPTVSVSVGSKLDMKLTVMITVEDSDDDLVVGSVWGPILKAGQIQQGVIGSVSNGLNEVLLDVNGIVAGTYPITIHADDGADIDGEDGTSDYVELSAGTITIE